MSAQRGAWVAFYSDYSDVRVFAEEIDALRAAVDSSMDVVFVPDGDSIREADQRRRSA